MSLVARHLEAAGIPTVILGAARDIVENVGVPRFAFSDVPLGNSAGRPHDVASQRLALECALRLLETAPGPRTTWQTPIRWRDDGDHGWKRDFMALSVVDVERARAAFDQQKELAKQKAAATGSAT